MLLVSTKTPVLKPTSMNSLSSRRIWSLARAQGIQYAKWSHQVQVEQRQNRKKGRLESERVKRLEEIGFVWDTRAEKFEIGFNALIKYKEEFGHLRVPQNTRLTMASLWVLGLAVRKIEYSKGILDSEKVQRLDQIGFIWEPRKKTTS